MTDWLEQTLDIEIVPKWRAEHNELAKHLRAVFERTDVDVVLDVGANEGQYHDFLRLEVGFEGIIHSFEPIRKLYESMLARSREDPQWHIHHCALGSTDGQTSINLMEGTQFSSILAPKLTGLNNYDQQNSVKEVQQVALRRLDTLIAETPPLAAATNIYLKLDTQGFDLEAFGGAGAALEKVVALQSEVSLLPIYEGMPDYRQSIATYNEGGFEISGMFPIVRDEYLRVVEFDCVAVKPGRVRSEKI